MAADQNDINLVCVNVFKCFFSNVSNSYTGMVLALIVNCFQPVRSWCEGFCEGGVSQLDSEAGHLEVSLVPVKQVILRFPWLQ